MPNKLKEKFKKLFIAEMSPGVILAAYRLLYDGDIPNTIDQSLLVNNAQKQGYIHIGTKERIELYKYLFVGDMGTVLVKDNDAGFYPETVSGMLQQLNLEANGELQNFTDTPPVLDNPEDPTTLGDFYEGEAPTATDMMEQFAAATGLMLINGEMLEDVEFPEDFATMPFSEFLTTTAEASRGYFSIIDDRLVFIPFGGYGANLIKDGFSDFTVYQGATVTKNKTFPIDVFKGGRNLYSESLSSNGFISDNSGNIVVTTENETRVSPFIPIDNVKYSYFLTYERLKTTSDIAWSAYTLYDGNKQPIGARQADYADISLGQRRSRTVSKIGEYINAKYIRVSARWLTSESIVCKLEVASGTPRLPTPYSPAPEDGYDYTGDDGATHWQTSGGTDIIKAFKNIPLPNIGETFNIGINVHPFTDMRVGSYLGRETLTPNVTKKVELIQTINTTVSYGMQFITIGVSDPLDFIASDPSIRESYPLYKKFSFTAMTPHDILGIHRLIGSDNVNDAHNQKILIENAEAMGFIQVNTNTRAHVGETVYIDVQGNVYVYPDPALID